ncbi:MAG: carboxypeptidase regulatory-like domain-containing protein [Bryobacterales bacterium]|nr:carboxypeptidase regulatory-like domain-containing protein [Bryobacterales bacterium]
MRLRLASYLLASVAAFAADPILGPVTIKPTFIPPGTPTQVTFTVQITDTTLLTNGANVQRLNAAGTATGVVGTLRDDGQNGDAVANDRIFTLVFSLNEPNPGRVYLRSGGAFPNLTTRVPSSTVAIDVGAAATPLAINGTAAPAPNTSGWNRQDVTITYSCSGGAGGSATCPAIARITTEGTAQPIVGTANDGAGNAASKTISINLDRTPPALFITSPPNNTVVATPTLLLTGTATDAVSGIASFTCNGQSAALAGSNFSCSVPLAPGANAITVQATDNAGNTATSTTNVTFSFTTLTLSAAATPAPNTLGWNNSDVNVAFTCTGGAMPVKCPQDLIVSTEGANQVIARTATDALNSTASSSVTVKIDKTPPALTVTSPPAAAAVTNPQLTITGTATDTLSSLARVVCGTVQATVTANTFTCNLTLSNGLNNIAIQAFDNAGNVATVTRVVTLGNQLTISATPTPAPNPAGWNNTNVTVSFNCAGGVGTVTCPQPVTASTEGDSVAISRTATDGGGNSATASVTLKIDKTAPVIAVTSPANGTTVATASVTFTGTVTEGLSGLTAFTCNGAVAAVAQAAFTCDVKLTPGSNTIVFQATDRAGNIAATSLSLTYTTPKLLISAAPAPGANAAGWHNANVTVSYTCSGGAGTITCPPPVTVTTEGGNQIITRTATDTTGNSASASVTLRIDKTPPSVAISAPDPGTTVAPPQVTISGAAADLLSGVDSVLCNNVKAALTPGLFSCVVPLAAGANPIVVQALDTAGNAATATITITRSNVGPVISLSGAPVPNASGWNNANVTVSATCSGGTGAVTCPQPLVVSTEAANQVITRTATDSIGNSTSASISLNIDKTPPVVGITSPANATTVNTPQIAITGPVSDTLSGVASVQCNAVPGALTPTSYSCVVPLVSGSNTVNVQATDRAGNTASATVSVTLTTSGPVITLLGTPPANAAGWNNANVTVSATCSGGTGAVTCPPPLVVSTEAANQVITRTATDSIGNSTSASLTLNIDKTAPVVAISSPANGALVNTTSITVTGSISDALSGAASALCNAVPATINASTYSCVVPLTSGANSITIQAKDKAGNSATASVNVTLTTAGPVISLLGTPAPNGAGWNNANVTVTATCSGGTGAVTCPQPLVVSTEAANQVISRTATDSLGNSTSASITLNIDKTQPVVNVTSPVSGATVSTSTVSITGTASDALSGLASVLCNTVVAAVTQSTFTCVVPLVSGSNAITVQASDKAGNTASASLTVTSTASVLSLLLSALPTPNAAGWNNADVTVSATCSGGNGAVTCPPPLVVSTEGANQVITRTATDASGGSVSASVSLRIDKTPPLVAITSPAPATTVLTPQATITGTTSDALSGVSAVTCNGVNAVVASGTFTCSVTLSLGPNPITVVASDIAGNTATASVSITLAPPLTISLSSPSNLSYLNLSPTTVSGTVSDSTATVVINGISTPVAGGSFSAQIPLAEGPNLLTATGSLPSGATATATVSVTLDTTPPRVTILNPPDKFVTADASIAVSGSVNDIVVGTVNDQQAQVTVNGLSAQVSNRTFLAASVPLAMGDNVIRAVGRDRAGNSVTAQVTVTRQSVTGPAIRLLSGNNQSGTIGAALSAPLVVALVDGAGAPIANKPVIFKVTQNDGLISAGAAPAATVIANTNAQGQAQVQWTLGFRAGAGGNVVEAYSVGHAGTAVFSATGNQGPAGKIVIDTGNAQIGVIGQSLPKPFIAVVVDAGNNRLAGVPVTFRVTQGGGTINGQPSYTVNSDSDGRVAALLTLGFQEGNANNLVEASFIGNVGYPAAFTASGRAPGNPAQTSISGVVLDNSNAPIPGVTVRAVLTNTLNSNSSSIQSVAAVQTNAQGQFTIPNAPVGFVKLLVDGSTAQLAGKYPTLDYDLVTISGQPNNVGQPIYLLPLNSANQLCVTASTGGGTLTIADAPGFSLTFGPGQVTFPGGSKTGCVSVTVVHPDKVPMSPGFGQQPRFIVTIQPAGAVFNPPAPITLPNVDGLKPRQVTEMYSFDHDIGSFVAIGTGLVSDEGQVIRSSSGVGVIKAGWHCGGNAQSTATAECTCTGRCAFGGSVFGEALACFLARPAYCEAKFGSACQVLCGNRCDPELNTAGFEDCVNRCSAARFACLGARSCPFTYCEE